MRLKSGKVALRSCCRCAAQQQQQLGRALLALATKHTSYYRVCFGARQTYFQAALSPQVAAGEPGARTEISRDLRLAAGLRNLCSQVVCTV